MSTTRTSPVITRLRGVTYDMYVRVRDDPGNDGLRMAYHNGVLEIMSPQFRHDRSEWHLGFLVQEYAVALRIECEASGSTTFRKGVAGERKGHGKEPDVSFYLRDSAEYVCDLDDLDLTTDPPPSLWIEVDNRASSAAKLPLYAALGIPEVWRYRPRSRRLWFGRLRGTAYESLDESAALPGLTPPLVLELLDEARARGATAWLIWLREVWFPEHRQELLDRGAGRS
jgi:Uma2 family endonuclease